MVIFKYKYQLGFTYNYSGVEFTSTMFTFTYLEAENKYRPMTFEIIWN